MTAPFELNIDGQSIDATNPVPVDRPGDGMNRDVLAATATVTPGVPLVVTPAAGKKIRLWWLTAIPSPDNVTTGRVTATLVGKGEIYRCYAIGHRQRFDGNANGTLTVASVDGTYEVTIHFEEIT